MALVKTFGTIVTKVSFNKVAVIIRISETTGETYITLGQRGLERRSIRLLAVAQLQYGQAAHPVLPEVTVIGQSCFHIHIGLDILVTLREIQILRSPIGIDNIYHVALVHIVILSQLIEEWFILAGSGISGQTGYVIQSSYLQPLCYEVQILVQLELCLQLVTTRFFISFYLLGIRIDVFAIAIVTKHDMFHMRMFGIPRISSGEQYRIRLHDLPIQIGTSVQRSVIVFERTIHTYHKLGRLRQFDIDIGT